jgi:queuosine precursor transporter
MNECIFLFHIITILVFTLVAFRLGKMALGSWLCIQVLSANLFVMKQVVLFGFHVTCSDVFAIGSILSLNLMQEYFGPEEAKKTTTHCFYFMLFFAILSQIHLIYGPSMQDTTQKAYETVLAPAPRLLFASLLTFFLVQKIDIRLFGKLKTYMPSSSFALRTFFSLLVSQFLDTLLFSYIGLYGLVYSISDMIFLSFVIKAFVICVLFPLTHLSRKWIQPKEFKI